MTDDQHDGHLGAVYSATRPEEIAGLYDAWAETYDIQMRTSGYRHPTICAALLARHLSRGAGPILDAGAGTGQMGEWLTLLGYPEVEALDISDGMLAVAARKGVYRAFHKMALGGRLSLPTDHYAAIVSTGVFTTGHVGPEALDELARITRPGGLFAITVKDTIWHGGFAERVDALCRAGTLMLIDETPPYISMPEEPGTTPGRGIVLRVT